MKLSGEIFLVRVPGSISDSKGIRGVMVKIEPDIPTDISKMLAWHSGLDYISTRNMIIEKFREIASWKDDSDEWFIGYLDVFKDTFDKIALYCKLAQRNNIQFITSGTESEPKKRSTLNSNNDETSYEKSEPNVSAKPKFSQVEIHDTEEYKRKRRPFIRECIADDAGKMKYYKYWYTKAKTIHNDEKRKTGDAKADSYCPKGCGLKAKNFPCRHKKHLEEHPDCRGLEFEGTLEGIDEEIRKEELNLL